MSIKVVQVEKGGSISDFAFNDADQLKNDSAIYMYENYCYTGTDDDMYAGES
jgi:hypothetical protein